MLGAGMIGCAALVSAQLPVVILRMAASSASAYIGIDIAGGNNQPPKA